MAVLRTCLFIVAFAAVCAYGCHGSSQSPRRVEMKMMEDSKEENKPEKPEKPENPEEKFDANTLEEYKAFKNAVETRQAKITTLDELKAETNITDDAKIDKFLEIAEDMKDTIVVNKIKEVKK